MAEIILVDHAEQRHLPVLVRSAGVSSEEQGNPIDHRAQRELLHAGYAIPHHLAHRVTRQELEEADLVLPMTRLHRDALRRLCTHYGIHAEKVRLYREFDPECSGVTPTPDVADPWYGDSSGFVLTRIMLERCTPHILDYVEQSFSR